MQRILEGISKFQREVYPQRKHLFKQLASSQSPQVLFITCADSRIVPDLITQSDPGDLFICRNAGNIVPPYGEMNGGVSATIEYAVTALGVKHIIVCGHSDCGAMRGVLHPEKVRSMPIVSAWLRHGDVARAVVDALHPQLDDENKMPLLTKQNVIAQLDNLVTHPSVAAKLAAGAIDLHGWFYHIENGEVEGYDAMNRKFVPVAGAAPPGTIRRHSHDEVLA